MYSFLEYSLCDTFDLCHIACGLFQSAFYYIRHILAGQGVQVTSSSKMLGIITLSEVKCDCDAKYT